MSLPDLILSANADHAAGERRRQDECKTVAVYRAALYPMYEELAN